jgi:hypothetical protein
MYYSGENFQTISKANQYILRNLEVRKINFGEEYGVEIIIGEKEYNEIYEIIEKITKPYNLEPKESIKAKILYTNPKIKSLIYSEAFITSAYSFNRPWIVTNNPKIPQNIKGLDAIIKIDLSDQFRMENPIYKL